MENWEIQEIKDELIILGYKLRGARESEMLNKTFAYINDLEKRMVEIAKDEDRAIKLLKENGYIVKKLTERQIRDSKRCDECSAKGEDVECLDCSCSVCIVQ